MLKNPLETGNHANATTNAPSAIAERDKSRLYAVRQITTISRLVEDTKSKGMLLVAITI